MYYEEMKQLRARVFNKWVQEKGKSEATSLIAKELGLSTVTADKIVRDSYQHRIRPFLRARLAALVGVSEQELFK